MMLELIHLIVIKLKFFGLKLLRYCFFLNTNVRFWKKKKAKVYLG